jgi:hypothetical protein
VSEIPFVNRLGDALDEAIAASPERAPRRRPRRRRFGGLALAVFLLGAGGVTIAAILDDPEKLAAAPVACYDRAALDANVYAQHGEGRSPAVVCADVLRTRAPLAACVRGESVAVFPGPPQTCERLGLRPLPRGYADANAKLARLRAEVDRIMASADCIPPEEMVRRVQRVLDRFGWQGWRSEVDTSQSEGPCGWVPSPILIEGRRRVVPVFPFAPRSVDRLVNVGAARDVFDESIEQCFTIEGFKAHARRRLAKLEYPLSFTVERGPMPDYEQLDPPRRQQRFDAGCAVANDVFPVYPRPGKIAIRFAIRVKER